MNVAHEQLILETVSRFHVAGIPNAEAEAERLATQVLGVSLLDRGSLQVLDQVPAEFVEYVRGRAARVPLERLLGSVRFRNIELSIGDGVFVPQPETEPVVQWCVDALAAEKLREPLIVDLCTGSGAVALSLANEVPGATVHAVELDPSALSWAQRNADQRSAAGDRAITLHLGDIKDALHELDGAFDLVVSNPPYVADNELDNLEPEVREHDPRVAFQGGRDGLDLVRSVEVVARRLLRNGGLLAVEHSDRQGRSAPAIFKKTKGWLDVEEHVDQEGRDRFVTARLRSKPSKAPQP